MYWESVSAGFLSLLASEGVLGLPDLLLEFSRCVTLLVSECVLTHLGPPGCTGVSADSIEDIALSASEDLELTEFICAYSTQYTQQALAVLEDFDWRGGELGWFRTSSERLQQAGESKYDNKYPGILAEWLGKILQEVLEELGVSQTMTARKYAVLEVYCITQFRKFLRAVWRGIA